MQAENQPPVPVGEVSSGAGAGVGGVSSGGWCTGVAGVVVPSLSSLPPGPDEGLHAGAG